MNKPLCNFVNTWGYIRKRPPVRSRLPQLALCMGIITHISLFCNARDALQNTVAHSPNELVELLIQNIIPYNLFLENLHRDSSVYSLHPVRQAFD